jgi:hypothetical protein
VTLLLAWFLADFLTGIVHWIEDRLLVFDTKIGFLEGIKRDNELHHAQPTALIHLSYWQNISTSAPLAWAAAGLLFWIGAPPVVTLAVFFSSFANLIHRLAHTPPDKLPRIILWLQRSGLLLSKKHHDAHHYGPDGQLLSREQTSGIYCAMTNWLNPILDYLGLFNGLERLIKIVLSLF